MKTIIDAITAYRMTLSVYESRSKNYRVDDTDRTLPARHVMFTRPVSSTYLALAALTALIALLSEQRTASGANLASDGSRYGVLHVQLSGWVTDLTAQVYTIICHHGALQSTTTLPSRSRKDPKVTSQNA